jgi:hypothetical protein
VQNLAKIIGDAFGDPDFSERARIAEWRAAERREARKDAEWDVYAAEAEQGLRCMECLVPTDRPNPVHTRYCRTGRTS